MYLFGVILFVAVIGFGGRPAADSSIGMAALVVLIVFILIFALILLVIPVFHILGQWAGYRVLKGDDYRYPILGNLVKGSLQ